MTTAVATADKKAAKKANNAEIKASIKKYKLGPFQRLWRIVVGLFAVHVGTLMVVAIYYLLFEVNPHMTNWWHTTVSNGDLRHTIRDVAEGVLGALLAKAVVWNHFSKGHLKAGKVYDFLKAKTHLPSAPLAIFASVFTFAVLFTIGYVVLEHLHVHATAAASGGVWSNTQAIWTDGYVNKILGFVCTFLAVRPLHNIYDDMQGYFAGRRAVRWHASEHTSGKPFFFYPGNFKNRFRYLVDFPGDRVKFAAWVPSTMRVLFFVAFGLAVYGWYILAYVA